MAHQPGAGVSQGRSARVAVAQRQVLLVVLTALIAVALVGTIFVYGFWSNSGRVASPEHYARTFAALLPFGYAFAAGMVASLNPCGFLMLPAFIGYQIGTRTSEEISLSQLGRAIVTGATVTVGFVVLFAAIGAVIAGGGHTIVHAFPWLGFITGIALTLAGLWLVITGRPLGIAWASRVVVPAGRGLLPILLYGVAYGVVSLSCTLPVFLVVVATSLAADGFAASLGQFLGYALGMGTVVIAVSLAAVSVKSAIAQSLRNVVPYVHRLSAIFLLGAGIYVTCYWVWLGRIFG